MRRDFHILLSAEAKRNAIASGIRIKSRAIMACPCIHVRSGPARTRSPDANRHCEKGLAAFRILSSVHRSFAFRRRNLSRKRVLNPAKNIARDSPGRIARCFRCHENDLQNLRRASAHRTLRRPVGGVCGESDAGVGVVLSRQKTAFEWCRLRGLNSRPSVYKTYGLRTGYRLNSYELQNWRQ